jgi:hypothetical protein
VRPVWLVEGFGLIGRRKKRRSSAAQIGFLQNQRALQQHFHLGATFNINVCAAREEGNQPGCGQPSPNACKTPGEWVPRGNPSN